MKSLLLILSALLFSVNAFAPVAPGFRTTKSVELPTPQIENVPTFQKQRHSVSTVQTCGLFGLGVPELAVIAIAAAFLLGPQKLAELGKDAGKIAGELKEVPKEFQKGLEEGELEAKQIKEGGDAKDAEIKD